MKDITNKEKRYFMDHMRLFKKDYDERFRFCKGLRRHNRKMLENKMWQDTRLMNHYDHCMAQLRYNNLSSFIEESDYFKPLLGYLRRK